MVIEKLFDGDKITTIRNTDNNRIADDIIGDNEFSDIKLIERLKLQAKKVFRKVEQ